MNGTPTESAPGRPQSLIELATELRMARQDVLAHRLAPVNREHLVLAQRSLLRAMQNYASQLSACGLPVPHRLRDDLRLQGAICAHPR